MFTVGVNYIILIFKDIKMKYTVKVLRIYVTHVLAKASNNIMHGPIQSCETVPLN